MQLTFQFAAWQLSAGQGIVGRQYDNLSHSLVVVGDLPAGYTWDMLVEARGKYNVIPLTSTETGAFAPLTDDQLAFGDTYYAFQLRGVQGDLIHHTNAVQVYVPETIVGPGTWPVLPTEFSQAEANIRELNAYPPVPGENGYWMLWDLDTHSYVQSQLVVPGLHIEIGETTTGEPGTPASVTNSGTDTAPVLDFTIPEGEEGDAATIQVGEVTASAPGSDPKVTNSGTENAAVFDFVLPRGQTGPTGQAATIEVASTATGEPGTQASVENVGTTAAAKLKFTIPKGDTGKNGVTPTLAAGDVETLEPDQPATASVTGEGPAYQINLGIPRGKTGAQGTPGKNGQTPTIAVGTVTTLDPGQPATAEITGETPNLTLNLGIPQGPPGQDGVQLNGSAINTTETWSSKKIVDTLCSSFSVSGNPVTCNPVEGYPLSAVVTLEPKQVGSGDPSPENIRPISGWDKVQVTRCGKNLLDPLYTTRNAGDIYWGRDSNGIRVEKGKTYTFSNSKNLSLSGLYVRNIGDNKAIFIAYSKASLTFTPSVTANVWFQIYNVDAIDDDVELMLELGTTPTPYEPYQGDTYDIALPETVYGGTVDAVTGVGEKTWGFMEFDGTENWEMNVNNIVLYDAVSAPANTNPGTGYCSHLPFAYNFVGDNIFISVVTIYLGTALSAKYTLESWKSYLAAQASAGTPVQVAYKLATPEPFQSTGNQALPAVAGLNTVYTDGDSLSVTGRQDLLYTLQNMQAETTNLNRFIAEGGAING